jgi:hypothetical protein
MNELFLVIAITLLAVISPGPDFAMVTATAMPTDGAVVSALGIACGVQVHVFYTVFGVALIITQSPLLFWMMKLLGAAYLVYLGIKSFTNQSVLTFTDASASAPRAWKVLLRFSDQCTESENHVVCGGGLQPGGGAWQFADGELCLWLVHVGHSLAVVQSGCAVFLH